MINSRAKAALAVLLTGLSLISFSSAANDRSRSDLLAILDLNSKQENTISLQEAIDIALQQHSGIVERAHIEIEDSQVKFNIEISSGSSVRYLQIDPKSGQLISQSLDLGETIFNYLTLGMTSFSTAQEQSVTENFRKGLVKIKGQIIALELDQEDGLLFYEVRSLHDSRLSITLISGQTGETVFFRNFGPHDHESRRLVPMR